MLIIIIIIVIIIIIIIISRSICKLPVGSEIHNCTFKNSTKVSIIIIIIIIVKKAFPWGVLHCKRKEEVTLGT